MSEALRGVVWPLLFLAVTLGPFAYFAARAAGGPAYAVRILLLVFGGAAALLIMLRLTPDSYRALLLAALLTCLTGGSALSTWRSNRQASGAPTVHRLRRTHYQRHSLWIAAFLVAISAIAIVGDLLAEEPGPSSIYWLPFGLIVIQLLVGWPSGRITEAGILVHGTLLKWRSLRNLGWVDGEPATLAFRHEKRGRLMNGKLKLNPADVEPVTTALIKYGDYSPIAGS